MSADTRAPVRSGIVDAVQRRSWEWLLKVRRRFEIDVEIIDTQLTPAFSPSPDQTTQLRHLIATRSVELHNVVVAALRTAMPQTVVIGLVQCVCFPLTLTSSAGAVLVARRLSVPGVPRYPGELEAIGRWLSVAIEGHLSSPRADATELIDRISTLSRLLADVAEDGLDRHLVARFADALAVWQDLEVYGYVRDPGGMYVCDVMLPGAPPSLGSASFPRAAVAALQPLRLFPSDSLPMTGDVPESLLVRIPGSDDEESWLLAIGGSAPPEDRAILQLYVEVLDTWFKYAAVSAELRMVRRMWEVLDATADTLPNAVAPALHVLREQLGDPAYVLLAVHAPTGLLVLTATSPPDAETAERCATTVRRRTAQNMEVSVSVATRGQPLTPHELRLVHSAADVFRVWFERSANVLVSSGERREARRSFEEVLEKSATELLRGGSPVAALVLSRPGRSGAAQEDVRRLRSCLRPTDVVGVTQAGDIGVLLADASRQQAESVARRLPTLLQPSAGDTPVPVDVGIATRAPGEPAIEMLAHARKQAWSDAGRN